MHSFVATSIPAGAALEEGGVVEAADENLAAGRLLLKMALKAEGGIALGEELGVDRTVRMMTGGAAFPQRFVFEHMGTALGGVAFETALVLGEEGRVSTAKAGAVMRVVAIGAGQMTFGHRMTVGQAEGTAHVQVTGEADFGGLVWINNQGGVAARLDVEITRTMTGFAANLDGVGASGLESRVTGGGEITDEVVVALGTGAGPRETGARNRRRHHDGAGKGRAGEEEGGQAQTERDEGKAAAEAGRLRAGGGRPWKGWLHIVARSGSAAVRLRSFLSAASGGTQVFNRVHGREGSSPRSGSSGYGTWATSALASFRRKRA